MKITIRVIGKLKESYFKKAEEEYLKRLRPYTSLSIVEYKDEESLIKALRKEDTIVALDEKGKTLDSAEFARKIIDQSQIYARGNLDFIVGGADGHSDALRKEADQLLSFGRMTLGHRMVRLVLLEQIYRGFKIIRGEPYHRGN